MHDANRQRKEARQACDWLTVILALRQAGMRSNSNRKQPQARTPLLSNNCTTNSEADNLELTHEARDQSEADAAEATHDAGNQSGADTVEDTIAM